VDYHEAGDEWLLGAAANGDRDAFAAFYRRWLPPVTRYHLRRTQARELAFDLTAETFAAVVAGCGRIDPARGPAAAWLFQIAEHKLTDSLRRARVESSARRRLRLDPVTLEDADLERVEELASLGDEVCVEGLLAQLPAEQRDVVRARVLDERSYADIARQLRCSEAVVRQRVHRGLSRMRERLKES
jgi:RNA polymerase sigma factor (sigma-70 family)